MKDLGVFVLTSSLITIALFVFGFFGLMGGHDTTDNLNEPFLAAVCALNAILAFVRGYLYFEPTTQINVLDEEQTIPVVQPVYSMIWTQLVHPLGLLISVSLLTYILIFLSENLGGNIAAWFLANLLKSSLLLSSSVAILLASIFHYRHLSKATT